MPRDLPGPPRHPDARTWWVRPARQIGNRFEIAEDEGHVFTGLFDEAVEYVRDLHTLYGFGWSFVELAP